MKFTVVFPSHESIDISYGLVFIPSPVWVQGEKDILSLNPSTPNYQKGGVNRLLEKEQLTKLTENDQTQCALIVHQTGHAQKDDLEALKQDLVSEGFKVKLLVI